MTPKILEVLVEARTELEGAVAWYKECDRVVASRFVAEVRRAIAAVTEAPERWPLYEGDARRLMVRGFPYGVIYRALPTRTIVVAVAHTSRRPRARTPSRQDEQTEARAPRWPDPRRPSVPNPQVTRAAGALKEADRIVFVGYRFPPTDAYSRSQLLGAISSNEKHSVTIHVVLGPHLNSADVARTSTMLKYSLERRPVSDPFGHVSMQPLWTEDFFSVVTRQAL